MTLKQLQKERVNARREKKQAKRRAAKERERLRIQRRKAKRAIKAAPRLALSAFNREGREQGYCDVCGPEIPIEPGKLHSHHILPKERYPEFKLERINQAILCPLHHKFGRWSAHRNPIWFVIWLKKNFPEKYRWAKEHIGVEPKV
jgi:hypothetical protein